MIFTKSNFFFLLLFGVIFSNEWVFEYKGETFFENDFYNYFPKSEWQKIKDNDKRESLFFDFVKHVAGVYEAKVLGLDLKPSVHEKLLGRFDRLLVNEYYMKHFLRTLVPKQGLAFCKKNLKKSVFTNHILVDKESFNLVDSLLFVLGSGADFGELALAFSKDPSAINNKGSLGWITIGQTVPDFQNFVFGLCVGCVGFVETDFGLHVVRVDSIKASSYNNLSPEEYDDLAFQFSTGYIKEPLKVLAEKHDSSLLSDFGVEFDLGVLSVFVEDIKRRLDGGSRNNVDFVSLLGELGVVARRGDDFLSGQWFANVFSGGFYKNVFYDDVDDLVGELKLVLLRDIVKGLALEFGMDNSILFKNQFLSVKNEILKKEYLKFIINSVPTPSKQDVEIFYKENEKELFVNKKTGEPFGLVSSYGSVEAILLKERQALAQNSFFDSLKTDFVTLNKGWLYVD